MMPRQGTLVSDNVGAQVSVEAPKVIAFRSIRPTCFARILEGSKFCLASRQTAGLGRNAFTPEAVR
jgi:hypothetical protein